jgi:hypothetical protein
MLQMDGVWLRIEHALRSDPTGMPTPRAQALSPGGSPVQSQSDVGPSTVRPIGHQSSVNTDCSRNRVSDDEHVRPWAASGVAWAAGTRGGGRDRAVAGTHCSRTIQPGHHISHSPMTGHPYARSIRRWRLTRLAIHESLRRHMAFPCRGVGEITRSSARLDSIQSSRCA